MANIQLASQEWVSEFNSLNNIATGTTVNSAYNSVILTPSNGDLYLANWTETYIGILDNNNIINIILPTPNSGVVNESILIFKIGSSLPTITQPPSTVWRGILPILVINSTWTIAYEQVNIGSGYEVYSIATKNV